MSDGPPTTPAPQTPRDDRDDRDAEDRASWAAWAQWGAVGVEFAAAVILFFLLGSWADARWGADPWLRVAGAFVGIVLGTYLLIRKALASNPNDRGDRPPRPRP